MRIECTFASPLGRLRIVANDTAITEVDYDDEHQDLPAIAPRSLLLQQACQQLAEYFAGQRQQFTLPLAPVGTNFQQAVWHALQAIPYAEHRSYKEISLAINNPNAMRAVGAANGRNPITIIIPCHRVIGASGKLVGYTGGVDRKVWLLEHEAKNRQAQ